MIVESVMGLFGSALSRVSDNLLMFLGRYPGTKMRIDLFYFARKRHFTCSWNKDINNYEMPLADQRESGARDVSPPPDPICFIFMQFSGEILAK